MYYSEISRKLGQTACIPQEVWDSQDNRLKQINKEAVLKFHGIRSKGLNLKKKKKIAWVYRVPGSFSLFFH